MKDILKDAGKTVPLPRSVKSPPQHPHLATCLQVAIDTPYKEFVTMLEEALEKEGSKAPKVEVIPTPPTLPSISPSMLMAD